jgi:hypothetical protein
VAALSIGAQGPSESAAYVQDNEVEDDEDEDDEEDEEPSSGQGYMADSQPEFHQGQPFQRYKNMTRVWCTLILTSD